MRRRVTSKTFWFIGLLGVLSVVILVKGCDQTPHPANPDGAQSQRIVLNIAQDSAVTMKATGVTIGIVGVNEFDEPIGPEHDPIIIPNPTFPLPVSFTLVIPPCRYRMTVRVDLIRDPPRTRSVIVDVCQETSREFSLDTFEDFTIGDLSIDAPGSANAGEGVTVSCTASQMSAPDSDRYPVSIELREQNGDAIGPIQNTSTVSGRFQDPYSVTPYSESSRRFTCTISDGRSPSHTVKKIMTRILPVAPTPTPTPLPTPRFTDHGNGTVTDNMTGRIWLQNANCFSQRIWVDATASANGLANGSCGLSDGSSAGDWRLPTAVEWQGLLDYTNLNPRLPTGHPFTAVQNAYYWSSTEYSATEAWIAHLGNGQMGYDLKTFLGYVWPVR